MSDSWIVVIPADPEYLPDESCNSQLYRTLSQLAPNAEDIRVEANGGALRFFDCGENFETVRCARCGKELETEAWSDWMGSDYGTGPGFVLSTRRMACCGVDTTLNDLDYDWPQGFAMYGISVKNHDRAPLSNMEVASLSRALGSPARIIYRYL